MDNGLSQTSKNVTREACDRCHTIKSRCSKAPDSVICKRCERFGVSCTYSAPLRRGRPKGGGSGGCSNMYSFPERPVQKRTRHARKKSDTSLQNATVEQDEPWMSLGMGIGRASLLWVLALVVYLWLTICHLRSWYWKRTRNKSRKQRLSWSCYLP